MTQEEVPHCLIELRHFATQMLEPNGLEPLVNTMESQAGR
jgi:hypothetical protein